MKQLTLKHNVLNEIQKKPIRYTRTIITKGPRSKGLVHRNNVWMSDFRPLLDHVKSGLMD